MRRARGFTLLELMVAVGIFGVLAALAADSFGKLAARNKQVGAVRDIYVYLLEARGQARVGNQPVRLDVQSAVRNGIIATTVRWGRLPCDDTWGRNCPSPSCGLGSRCGPGCECSRQGEELVVPNQLSFENLDGLCFLGATGQTRNSGCDAGDTDVRFVKLTLTNQPRPYVIVFDPLTGLGRLVDCTKPKTERPESVVGGTDRCD